MQKFLQHSQRKPIALESNADITKSSGLMVEVRQMFDTFHPSMAPPQPLLRHHPEMETTSTNL
ncbi:hypothetical protein D0U02_13650 [Burkholderia pseudomallei]|uniref:Uncharacterized protein n=3 Tax=Burkholderia pseudomallei TaxID=28450 RepID=A0A0H3HQX1_BURP2|nr:hypothetical protein BURPS1106A_1619 [Burkholderia pseudomallei 1106a]ACQ95302.1 conserved hypothetical protein [Burkholderia pseudomallei MSHR346]AFI66628.1 hypothetical protein BP1026B_I2012 [Burkholderia pseudomallei 1026b]ARK51180.1 hypothetical protein BOC35_35410 [Burkholderia pseudomallei]AVR10428.1 hypothetical protein A8H31_24555 [Burkholderia thailandensis]EES26908.1 hypothetical protein BURPS1106B_A0863 [Burkholderia pseudomallei 1106b]EIF65525.1 hypothetical protein BP1026A_114